jgi:hypothetical protein
MATLIFGASLLFGIPAPYARNANMGPHFGVGMGRTMPPLHIARGARNKPPTIAGSHARHVRTRWSVFQTTDRVP